MVDEDRQRVEWWALLAPSADASPIPGFVLLPHDAARVLGTPHRLGDVTLRPADRQIIEYALTASVGGWEALVSWPVIVEGSSNARTGSNPWTAAGLAGPQAHLAACLVSLAWAEAWRIRVSPTPTASIAPQVPEFPSPAVWPETNAQIGLRAPAVLPPWLHDAWNHLVAASPRDPITFALTVWHQGMLLFTQHPSMALMAFVASIEAVASSPALAPNLPPQSQACPRCGHRPGAVERFWSAVGLVASDADLQALRKAKVYDLRSATGHRGATHGFERRLGEVVMMPLSEADEAGRFVGNTLRQVARIGRELLLRALAPSETHR